MTAAQQRPDIIDRVIQDHHRMEQLLDRFDVVGLDHRGDLFCDLTETLVRHEVAEEEIVYPTIRYVTSSADDIAVARIHEESEAEELLAAMEGMDATSVEFATWFAQLHSALLAHAHKEEAEVFPLLRLYEPEDELLSMGDRFDRAKGAAPTHAHPHATKTPSGNLAMGPVAVMVDRVRDAIHRSADRRRPPTS